MHSITAGFWPYRCYLCGLDTYVIGVPHACPQCGANIHERNKAALNALYGRRTGQTTEKDVEHMARTQIATNVRERLVNRLAVLMLSEAAGNDTAETRLNQTTWVLETVGYEPDLISELFTEARDVAGIPAVKPVPTGPDRNEPVATGPTDKPAEPAAPKPRPVSPAPKPA